MTVSKARQLVLLGILLQGLHVLFGVTAFIGVLITQTHIRSTIGTVYRSQLQWQFVTFWIAVAGYSAGLYIWVHNDSPWLMLAILAVVIYRLGISIQYWTDKRELDRYF